MKKQLIVFCIVLTFCFIPCAVETNQESPLNTYEERKEEESIFLSSKVTEAVTKNPPSQVFINICDTLVYTDIFGKFLIKDLRLGKYSITAKKNEYTTYTSEVELKHVRNTHNIELNLIIPSNETKPIDGINEFSISISNLGAISLVYCDLECKNIYYRYLLPDNEFSPYEIVKEDWNRDCEDYGSSNFSIDIDPDGYSHIIFGESGKLFHACNKNKYWDIAEISFSGVLGRKNSIKINKNGIIGIITSEDFRVGGGYPFSDLCYISGNYNDSLNIDFVNIRDEKIFDIDIDYNSSCNPIIAIAQLQWGGWHALKILYKNNNGEWTEKIIKNDWRLCVDPVEIIIQSSIHILSCHQYINLSYEENDGLFKEIKSKYSYNEFKDLTVDEYDNAYIASIDSKSVKIIKIVEDKFISIIVDILDSNSEIVFIDAKIAYYNNEIIIAYTDSNNTLRLKRYNIPLIQNYSLLITSNVGGTTDPIPGTYTYNEGAIVTITAIPDTHYKFNGWTGNVPSGKQNDNPISITMNSDKSIKAHFIRIIYPPLNFMGRKVENRSLFLAEYINVLTWQTNPDNENIVKYRIYQVEGDNLSLLFELSSDTFIHWHRRVEKNKSYTYSLVAVNSEGREGIPAYITVQ